MERMYVNVEAANGANITATIIPGRYIPPQPDQLAVYDTAPQVVKFNTTTAPTGAEAYNNLEQYVTNGQTEGALPIQSKQIMVQFTEPGSPNGFEMLSWGVEVIKEALDTA
jgi:hypothetical protein